MTTRAVSGSFRDPDGFLFYRDEILHRQINASYQPAWDLLHQSGLLAALTAAKLLIPHHDVPAGEGYDRSAWRVIRPEPVPFISYPYEWTPSQWRQAAQLTLRIQTIALQHGMVLKDASAYNVQFIGHRPVFIDTLSFAPYRDGEPWVAYRQFCQHFLGPLALMRYADPRLRELSRSYLDGIPLDLCSALLPRRSWCRPSLLLHVHLHARSIRHHGDRAVPREVSRRGISRRELLALIEHLSGAVEHLAIGRHRTEWHAYETSHNYSSTAQAAKEAAVAAYARAHAPRLAFDLGANAGHYSRLLQGAGAYVVAPDSDLGAVEAMGRRLASESIDGILPLWMDLTNPAPAQGWAHRERDAFAERGPADMVLALALVHHLAIGNNVPLPAIAEYLSRLGRRVVLEWVPKDDPQVGRLLTTREDVFADYTLEAMLAACDPWFVIEDRVPVPDSNRVLLMLARR